MKRRINNFEINFLQVCNWFANWRRKLKNSGKEPQSKTWGDLIKTYNHQVHGNIEHFSICSDDSIWYETDSEDYTEQKSNEETIPYNNNNNQCFLVSSTTGATLDFGPFVQPSNKYKSHIMEKYLRDCQQTVKEDMVLENDTSSPSVISKWLESAANFKPNENSYLDVEFFHKQRKKVVKPTLKKDMERLKIHGREELDAAEALTTLANSSRNKAQ